MTDSNRGVWLVLGSGTLLGVAILGYYLLTRPTAVGLDYRVYHVAAKTALGGGDVYAVTPADSGYHYLYPPVTVLAFAPLAALGDWTVGYLVLTLVSLAASALAARALCQYVASLGYAVSWREHALVAGFLAVSSHTAPSLVYGQVNHLVVAGLVVGLAVLLRGRQHLAGVVLALPAYVKLLPGVVGVYMLRRHTWRAIAAAAGTAIALTVLGVLSFGVELHLTYVTEAVLPRRETAAFVGGLDPAAEYVTLRRPLSVAFPNLDPTWYAVGAATVLLPVLAVLLWRVETRTDRHVALHGTLTAGVLFFPSLLLYYAFLAFPLVVLLFDLPPGRPRRLFVAGATLANVSMAFGEVEQVLAVTPLDATTVQTLAATVRPVFAFGTPVLYGCLLMLAGCLVYRWERGLASQATRPESSPR